MSQARLRDRAVPHASSDPGHRVIIIMWLCRLIGQSNAC